MPVTAFLHTHVLVIILFLLLFTFKVVLLLLNKHDTLTSVRNKTKVPEMVLGTLILITGGWLLFNYNGGIPTWLVIKIVLVLVAIPVGIIGLKQNNKVFAVVALLLFLYVYGITETDSLFMQEVVAERSIVSPTPGTDATETGEISLNTPGPAPEEIVASLNETALTNAWAIYVNECANCHGEDGAKGTSGAANLQQSQLSLNARKEVIANGRALMPAYGSKLNEQELDQLAAYTMTLKE